MKIYLVRHGIALTEDVDPEKHLSPKGIEEVQRIARFLGKKSFPISAILSSKKPRAKETALIMKDAIAPDVQVEENDHLNPNDPIEPILNRIAGEQDCMIVGHLPFLQKISAHLVVGNQDFELIHFQAGTVVCLEEFSGNWLINWVVGLEQS